MGSKTVIMNSKPEATEDFAPTRAHAALGIQSDTAFSEASKRLHGRDLCSIADLTVQEMAAIMELAHAVKRQPRRLPPRRSTPSQMVMFFEKASLRTRLTFESRHEEHSAAAPPSSTRPQSPLGERESIAGHRPQPRALDGHHRPPHLLA